MIASLAESGYMVGGLLRDGNAEPAEDADTWIPHLVQRLAVGELLERTDHAELDIRRYSFA